MKKNNLKYCGTGHNNAGKTSGELENLLRLTEDEELQRLLGMNSGVQSTDNIQELRLMWKKEKNRIAAKKSREKKANLMLELEKKEIQLSNEVETLRRFLVEYDSIIESLLKYIKCTLSGEWAQTMENVQNNLAGIGELEPHEKDMYRKLSRCLEYFYHMRNNEVYFTSPGMSGPARQDTSNRLIDEILYAIKFIGGLMDNNKM